MMDLRDVGFLGGRHAAVLSDCTSKLPWKALISQQSV